MFYDILWMQPESMPTQSLTETVNFVGICHYVEILFYVVYNKHKC